MECIAVVALNRAFEQLFCKIFLLLFRRERIELPAQAKGPVLAFSKRGSHYKMFRAFFKLPPLFAKILRVSSNEEGSKLRNAGSHRKETC